MATLIEVRDLSKIYARGKQKVEVLHGIQLDVDEGKFLALMGPSGSGKTTLLNLIGGLDQPTGGSISVGGQQQRVSIARAIVSDPALLICDEPTGDLDRQSAEEVLMLLRTLNREHGKTIVMVTHDPKAASYADLALHLDKGTLVQQTVAATAAAS